MKDTCVTNARLKWQTRASLSPSFDRQKYRCCRHTTKKPLFLLFFSLLFYFAFFVVDFVQKCQRQRDLSCLFPFVPKQTLKCCSSSLHLPCSGGTAVCQGFFTPKGPQKGTVYCDSQSCCCAQLPFGPHEHMKHNVQAVRMKEKKHPGCWLTLTSKCTRKKAPHDLKDCPLQPHKWCNQTKNFDWQTLQWQIQRWQILLFCTKKTPDEMCLFCPKKTRPNFRWLARQ